MLSNPALNPFTKTATGVISGTSLADMKANDDNPDNNIIKQHNTFDTLSSLNGVAYSFY